LTIDREKTAGRDKKGGFAGGVGQLGKNSGSEIAGAARSRKNVGSYGGGRKDKINRKQKRGRER